MIIKFLKTILLFTFINFIVPFILIIKLNIGPENLSGGEGGRTILLFYNLVIILIHLFASIVAIIAQSHHDIGNKLLRPVVISNCVFNIAVLYNSFVNNGSSEYSSTGYILITLYFIFDIYISWRFFREDDLDEVS